MKALLLPIILLLVGVGGGVGAGLFLKPEPVEEVGEGAHDCVDPETMTEAEMPEDVAAPEELDYVKLNNQFVIPVVEDGNVAALVVMSLNLEVALGYRETVFAIEPKLRDRFLQVMFDHANIGGFAGNFTTGTNMRALRNELLGAAQDISGNQISDVLVMDIIRQDS